MAMGDDLILQRRIAPVGDDVDTTTGRPLQLVFAQPDFHVEINSFLPGGNMRVRVAAEGPSAIHEEANLVFIQIENVEETRTPVQALLAQKPRYLTDVTGNAMFLVNWVGVYERVQSPLVVGYGINELGIMLPGRNFNG